MCETSDQICKHTPGPWKRGDCDSWIIWAPRYASTEWVSKGCTLGEPEAVVVAVVEAEAWARGGLDPAEREAWLAETDATANVIAAAPDLLEALKGFNLKEDWIVSGQADSITLRIPISVIQAAAAAVAKAEGRS